MFDFDRLYYLSKLHGVSKSHLCNLAGKNASYIADLRRQHREPAQQTVAAWAAALHTTPAYLMGETDDPTGTKHGYKIAECLNCYSCFQHRTVTKQSRPPTVRNPG